MLLKQPMHHFLQRIRSYCSQGRKKLFLVLPFVLLLGGCLESPVYQKQYSVPGNAWDYGWKPVFEFDITDTTSAYNLYFLVRHTEAYPNSNIWMKIHTKEPGDTVFREDRIEVPLAQSDGRWLGKGIGSVWEQRMPLTRNDAPMLLRKKGRYTIRLEQNMRTNPLPEVLQVGLRIEKAGTRTFENKP